MRRYLIKFLPHLGCGFFFSLFINVLQLAYLLYMRLLFDKVMISRSMETLLYLTIGVIGAYIVMGVLEVIRSKLLVRVGVEFDQVVAQPIFTRMIDKSVTAGGPTHTQGLKDLNSIRNFLGGAGIFAFYDTPWVPIYLAIIYWFHPWLAMVATGGAVILLLLVLFQEIFTGRLRSARVSSTIQTDQFLASATRNVESVNAMGMLPALSRLWKAHNREDVYHEDRLAARTGFFQSAAKMIMMATSAVVMAIGAYLVIIHEITIGTMVASSMIMGRALSPILMLGNAWKSLVESRLAYRRLEAVMAEATPKGVARLEGRPARFQVENVTHFIGDQPVLQNIDFSLAPGEILAIVGPSGAGKSTLARIVLGLWPPDEGCVRLEGQDIRELDPDALGRRIGYIPQDVELFSATVAENIARLADADDSDQVEAAMSAGAHQMILGLPAGYDTRVGRGGVMLSGGQKQRIALARALHGDPRLMVMDEPDSHLDQPGREALKAVLARLKEEDVTTILITHNQDLAKAADRILTLDRGRILDETPGGAPSTVQMISRGLSE
jgi:PrtD family type I secretion system ABC transporter